MRAIKYDGIYQKVVQNTLKKNHTDSTACYMFVSYKRTILAVEKTWEKA